MASLKVTAVHPDGTVTLEDGRTMRQVMSSSGSLGLIEDRAEDRVGEIDQHIANRPPSQGEYPAAPPGWFNTSGLD